MKDNIWGPIRSKKGMIQTILFRGIIEGMTNHATQGNKRKVQPRILAEHGRSEEGLIHNKEVRINPKEASG